MNYVSTRDTAVKVTASQAITKGISSEGGLFVPETQRNPGFIPGFVA